MTWVGEVAKCAPSNAGTVVICGMPHRLDETNTALGPIYVPIRLLRKFYPIRLDGSELPLTYAFALLRCIAVDVDDNNNDADDATALRVCGPG